MSDKVVLTGKKLGMGEAYLAGVRQAVTKVTLLAGTLSPGTVVSVRATTKGKGFQGVVKRYHFAGGFKTHGQSDRHRAPGSIGQGTTPGRVHKGKKMPGRMGGVGHTVKNSLVVALKDNTLWLTGPVPGPRHALLTLTVTGTRDVPQLDFLTGADLSLQAEKPTEEAQA